MNACGMENISDSIPKEPKKRFKAVKANLDSNSNN